MEKVETEKSVSADFPVITELTEEEDNYDPANELGDLVFSDRSAEGDPNVDYDDDYYSSATGLDDFIMGYDYEPDEPEKKTKKSLKAGKAEKAGKPAPAAKPEKPVNSKQLKKQEKAERKAAKKLEAEKKAAEKAEKAKTAKTVVEAPKAVPEAVVASSVVAAELEKNKAAKNAEKPAGKNSGNQQTVEEILAANMKRNSNKTANNAESSNVEKLAEELRKASVSRRAAEKNDNTGAAVQKILKEAGHADGQQNTSANNHSNDEAERIASAEKARADKYERMLKDLGKL